MVRENRGYKQDLMVLPFDHRGDFSNKMFQFGEKLSPEQVKEIASYKEIIFEGFEKAATSGLPKEEMGILVDEQFGSEIITLAKKRGYTVCVAADKGDIKEFDFAYGKDFRTHIEKTKPHFSKALAFMNVEGDPQSNERQILKLQQLSSYLETSETKFLLELIVPVTQAQLEKCKGDESVFDIEMRPRLMVEAIKRLQDSGIEPDIWKLEGLDRKADYELLAKTCRRDERDNVGIIVLGRGEDESKVRDWLRAGATVAGIIGFAVGRTIFWGPLTNLHEKKATREQAVEGIAANYTKFCKLWLQAREG